MSQYIVLGPCTWIYLLMIAITILTWYIGMAGFSGVGVSLMVLAMALVKGFLVGDYYMGLKWVRGGWRWLIIGWFMLPGALITWAFLLSE